MPEGLKKLKDKESFEALFRKHYSDLCAYANRYLNDILASEEVVQEMFVSLWSNREQLNITTSLQSYLFRAVRNSCLNVIKHIEVRETYKAYNEAEIKNTEINANDENDAFELEDIIREAINLLPPERKKVFIMSKYDGLKYKEIAEQLGISIKTVENQMGKALKFMREKLSEHIPLILIFLGVLSSILIHKILLLIIIFKSYVGVFPF